MEKFQEVRDRAKKHLKTADHLLSVTYPMVRDPKLLLAVVDNLFLSMTDSMGAILHYERMFKRIPMFQETFESKFDMFKSKMVNKHSLDLEYLKVVQDLKSIIMEHKKSPVEFIRNEKFVICDEGYRMKTISVDELKEYISKAKIFIGQVDNITGKDEGIFRRS